MIRSLFIAESIRLGARGIAADAAQTLLERHPEIAGRFGGGFARWQDFLTQRLHELSAAVEFDEPALFAHDSAWALASFLARSVPAEDLRRSYGALREALERAVAGDDAPAALDALDRGTESLEKEPPTMARLSPETPLGHLAVRYLEAALSGDRQSAITRVREALERGTPTLDLYEQVLVAAQREIGVMWHLGEISVPEEHAATDTTRSAMAVLAHLAERAPSNQRMALVGSTEGDTHDVGVRAVADLLELGGFGAVCLGANVPAEDLARACEDFDADLLALSASMSIHLPALASAIELVRARDKQRPRIMVGGPIFAVVPGLGERLGADAEAGSLSEAVERANELLS